MKRIGGLMIVCLAVIAGAVLWLRGAGQGAATAPARVAGTADRPAASPAPRVAARAGVQPAALRFATVSPVGAATDRPDHPERAGAGADRGRGSGGGPSRFEQMLDGVPASEAATTASRRAASETGDEDESWGRRVGPRPSRGVPATITPELIDEALRVAHDIDPRLAAQLRELREKQPEELERRLRGARRIWDLVQLKKEEPPLYDLKLVELRVDSEVNRLAGELRRARAEGRDSDAKALESQLTMQMRLKLVFEYRAREDYLCRLRSVVERLERELDEQRKNLEKNFDAIVDQRIEALVAQPQSNRPIVPALAVNE